MMRGLLAKELRQHGFTFAFLFLLLLCGLAVMARNARVDMVLGGSFGALHILLCAFAPLACLVLGQVLIATEFRQKTQLFLEGLPLPRWRMLAVKFALGLAVLLGSTAAMLFVAWWSGRGTDAMTPRFVVVLVLKSATWVWFLYALFFAHAFLGRYRIVFGLAIFFAFVALKNMGVRLEAFGPFALIDSRFPFERQVLPWDALAVTVGVGFGLALLGFALGLVRDATVASLLAERMSSREKVFITFLTITSLMLTAYLFKHYKTTTPVLMPGAVEAQRGIVKVFAAAAVDAPTAQENAALQRVADRAAEELDTLAEYLGCRTFPQIFIVHRRDLADHYSTTWESSEAVISRANLTAENFSEPRLHKSIVNSVLEARSSGLVHRERNIWIFAGMLRWWSERNATPPGSLNAEWLKDARIIMPADFSPKHLAAWYSLRDSGGSHGGNRTEALAALGLEVLAQRHGEDARRRFLSATFGPARPKDFRGWFGDVMRSKLRGLRATTGVSEKTFVEEWRAAVAAAPPTSP
jgi:hypothetical protein